MDSNLPPMDCYVHIPRRLQFLHREVGGAYEEPEMSDGDSDSTVAADESSSQSQEDSASVDSLNDLDYVPSEEEEDDENDRSYLGDD